MVAAVLTTSMVPAFAASNFNYEAQANKLHDMGLLEGISDVTFDPALQLSLDRETGITMLLRLIGKADEAAAMTDADATAALAKFADKSEVADWAKKAVAYAVKNGLVEGMTDTTVAPKYNLSGKMYATLILRNLGFTVSENDYHNAATMLAGKGGLTADEATKFNDKNLIRDDLVGIAFGSLKATDKDGKKVIVKLIEEGVVTADKAVAAGVYEAPATPTPVAKAFELTNKSKTLTVKLNYEPADASKVVFTVTRDAGIAVAATFVQDATDKTMFTFTSSANLVAGDYKVAVKDDTTDLGNKTVKVENEKVSSIEVTSKQIVRESKVKGYSYYKVTNQYGEDVTKMPIASNITWNSSLGSGTNTEFSADKGKLTFVKGIETDSTYMSQLKDFTTTPIVVTAYDRDSAVTYTKSLTASTSIGDIQSINLTGISNKDGKTTMYRGNNVDEFYVNYEIKDSNGDLVTDYNILKNALRIYPQLGREEKQADGSIAIVNDSVNIAAIRIKQDPSDLNKALFKVELRALTTDDMKNPYTGVGMQPINFVSLETGKSGQINVEVKEDTAQLESFVLQRPSVEVTASMGYVEVPYIATDANGNNVTQASKIKGFVDFSANGNLYREETLADGTYKLYVNFGTTKDTVRTFQATVKRTFKYSTVSVTVKDTAAPKTLSALPFDLYMTQGASTDKGFNDIKVLDKYENAIDLKNYNTQDSKSYFVVADVPTDKAGMFSVTGAAYGTKKIVVSAGATAGSADIKFYLVQKDPATDVTATAATVISENAKTNGLYKIVDTKTVTFYNVDKKDIVDYTMEAITFPVYVNPAFSDYANASAADKEYKQEIKVRGLLANGTKVKIPEIQLTDATDPVVGVIDTSYGVADAGKFATTGKYVYGYHLAANEGTAKTQATALVRGNDGVVKQVKADVTSSNATPYATAINVKLADPTTNDDGIIDTPVVKKTDIYYEIKATDFTAAFDDRYMFKYSGGAARTTAGLWFEIKDQYDKAVIIPSVQIVSQTDVDGNAINAYSIADGELNGTPTAGDSIVITVSKDAQAKTITLKLVN